MNWTLCCKIPENIENKKNMTKNGLMLESSIELKKRKEIILTWKDLTSEVLWDLIEYHQYVTEQQFLDENLQLPENTTFCYQLITLSKIKLLQKNDDQLWSVTKVLSKKFQGWNIIWTKNLKELLLLAKLVKTIKNDSHNSELVESDMQHFVQNKWKTST